MHPPDELLSSAQACALLEVKRATLYSYVSRGLIRCVRQRGAKRRWYLADDVRRVRARSAARRGHAPVAAGALRWGEPVLDSAITAVGAAGIRYRGQDVLGLVAASTPFERVVDHLWEAPPGEVWSARSLDVAATASSSAVAAMLGTVAALARDPSYGESSAHARERGRRLLWTFARVLAGEGGSGRVAEHLAGRLPKGRLRGSARAAQALDAALVLSADHELNVSTFAARIAASAGADLCACVGAALCVFTGPKHGGASARVAAFFDELPERPRERRRALLERLARGESLPGFGHPLYPAGDPRAAPLLAHARAFGGRAASELAELAAELTGEHPNLDFGLVALTRALGARDEMASALFALGRTAGWVAHVLEQRQSADLLRPRARYVGP